MEKVVELEIRLIERDGPTAKLPPRDDGWDDGLHPRGKLVLMQNYGPEMMAGMTNSSREEEAIPAQSNQTELVLMPT
jgi:hypothetical protein